MPRRRGFLPFSQQPASVLLFVSSCAAALSVKIVIVFRLLLDPPSKNKRKSAARVAQNSIAFYCVRPIARNFLILFLGGHQSIVCQISFFLVAKKGAARPDAFKIAGLSWPRDSYGYFSMSVPGGGGGLGGGLCYRDESPRTYENLESASVHFWNGRQWPPAYSHDFYLQRGADGGTYICAPLSPHLSSRLCFCQNEFLKIYSIFFY